MPHGKGGFPRHGRTALFMNVMCSISERGSAACAERISFRAFPFRSLKLEELFLIVASVFQDSR